MSLYILFIHGSWHRRPPLENAQPWAGARLSVQCITVQVYFTQILVKTGRPYIIVYGVHWGGKATPRNDKSWSARVSPPRRLHLHPGLYPHTAASPDLSLHNARVLVFLISPSCVKSPRPLQHMSGSKISINFVPWTIFSRFQCNHCYNAVWSNKAWSGKSTWHRQ